MTTHILVLQGAGEGAHAWDMPFIRTLEEQLGADYKIHFPKMPDEDNPKYGPWAGKIEQELQKVPDPVIVLGHSLGGSVFLKYLAEQKTNRKFPAVFLIATPFWGEPEWEVEEFVLPENFVSKLPVIGQTFIYHSEDDKSVPFVHHLVYKKHLPEATVRTFKEAGHEMLKAVPDLVKDIQQLG
jgi:uncharacterized protein